MRCLYFALFISVLTLVQAGRIQKAVGASSLSNTLMSWCSDDTTCKEMYFGTDSPNATVFKILTNSLLFNKNLNTPTEAYITNKTDAEINKNLWLLLLKLERSSQPSCGPNFLLSFDKNTLQMRCVCAHDRMCSSIEKDKILAYVVMGMTLVIVFFSLVVIVYRLMRFIDLSVQLSKTGMPMEEFLKKLL